MFKFLSKLVPYLLTYLKFLKGYKGLFLPYILIKLTEFLISFIIKAEKVGFAKMIKFIYFFLSGINLLLSLIVIFNFTDFQLPLVYVIIDKFKFIMPLMVIDIINQLIEEFAINFKEMIRNFINWVYNSPKIEVKSVDHTPARPGGRVTDPFQLGNYQFSDLDEEYIYSEGNTNWKTIALFAIFAIGISYYMYPDLYHNIYHAIKDRFFPDSGRGEGGGSTSATALGKRKVIDRAN